MAKSKQLYEQNGVEISKATINVGDEVTLLYKGLLAQNGADTVYAHIGYGDEWEEKDFLPMVKDEDVFKTTFMVNVPKSLNVAFKDGGENWDNNAQSNYSFKVTKKAAKVSEKSQKAVDSEEPEEAEKKSVTKVSASKKPAAKASAKSDTKASVKASSKASTKASSKKSVTKK